MVMVFITPVDRSPFRTVVSAIGAAKRRIGRVYRPLQRRAVGWVFDRGLDTTRPVTSEDLGLTGARNPYVASGWFYLRRGLRGWTPTEADVFIDLGSGKGRVVYQAARYPFGRVVGVELSDELTAVARGNIERKRQTLRCKDIQFVTADITAFPLPDDATVVYMFNPVGGDLFDRAIDNVIASLDRRPRRVRLIYASPHEERIVEATGRFELLRRSKGVRQDLALGINVYESRPQKPWQA